MTQTKMDICLVGYIPRFFWKKKHTNYWPWNYLEAIFGQLGYNTHHINANKIDHRKPNVYICWNEPDSLTLLEKYPIHKDSVIIQKLTSFDTSKESQRDWTDDPMTFFKNWTWPQYRKLDVLKDSGFRYYAFGAQSDIDSFPTKREIVGRHQDRIFWIPWGTMTVPHERIMKSIPIVDGFEYDLGFVGSKWGSKNRGNIFTWETHLQPLIDQSENVMLAGRGTPKGPVSVAEHIKILEKSRICPIIHAPSWLVEKGIMDRFWTVFSLGRFGVCDNEAIYDFYDQNEVVVATDPEDYLEKSTYFMQHVDKQIPYIEKALRRIQTEYNQYEVWKKILSHVTNE